MIDTITKALFAGLIAGSILGMVVTAYVYTGSAIENGCAQYNNKTGAFEWILKEH